MEEISTDPKPVKAQVKPQKSAFSQISDKQKVFVLEYLKCWNATKAARLAGYRDPECSGYENRQKPAIQAAIQEKIAERAMSSDEVLLRLGQQARGEHGNFWKFFSTANGTLSPEDLDDVDDVDEQNLRERLRDVTPYLDLPALILAGLGHLIKKYKTEDGRISEVEFYDAQAALSLLGRHHKLFTDKFEHSGAIPVSPYEVDALDGLERGELNRRVEEALRPPATGQ